MCGSLQIHGVFNETREGRESDEYFLTFKTRHLTTIAAMTRSTMTFCDLQSHMLSPLNPMPHHASPNLQCNCFPRIGSIMRSLTEIAIIHTIRAEIITISTSKLQKDIATPRAMPRPSSIVASLRCQMTSAIPVIVVPISKMNQATIHHLYALYL